MSNVEYLGDGVYVAFDGYHVILMTGSHCNPDNLIFLEIDVLKKFKEYVDKNIKQS